MIKDSRLLIILITAFLDILGIAIFIPILPDIISRFGISPSWTGYTQGVFALGMFLGGIYFGRLSDSYGRKSILAITALLGFLSNSIMLYSIWGIPPNIYTPQGIFEGFGFASIVFLISRFIGGLGGSGYSIVQAYISDISTKSSRTKNFGLIGAMFGLAFFLGPTIGALFSHYFDIEGVIIACSIVFLLNFLSILFFLEEHPRNSEKRDGEFPKKMDLSRDSIFLFALTFISTIALTAIQGMSPQYYKDVFGLNSTQIGYTLSFVGAISIVYQGFIVKYIRMYCDEMRLLQISFFILTVGFLGFSLNTSPYWLYFWLVFFPIGMGSFYPSLSTLLSIKAGREVGKIMGYNISVTSIGQIIGPIIMGTLYVSHDIEIFLYPLSGYILPFLFAMFLFAVLFIVSIAMSSLYFRDRGL